MSHVRILVGAQMCKYTVFFEIRSAKNLLLAGSHSYLRRSATLGVVGRQRATGPRVRLRGFCPREPNWGKKVAFNSGVIDLGDRGHPPAPAAVSVGGSSGVSF